MTSTMRRSLLCYCLSPEFRDEMLEKSISLHLILIPHFDDKAQLLELEIRVLKVLKINEKWELLNFTTSRFIFILVLYNR